MVENTGRTSRNATMSHCRFKYWAKRSPMKTKHTKDSRQMKTRREKSWSRKCQCKLWKTKNWFKSQGSVILFMSPAFFLTRRIQKIRSRNRISSHKHLSDERVFPACRDNIFSGKGRADKGACRLQGFVREHQSEQILDPAWLAAVEVALQWEELVCSSARQLKALLTCEAREEEALQKQEARQLFFPRNYSQKKKK